MKKLSIFICAAVLSIGAVSVGQDLSTVTRITQADLERVGTSIPNSVIGEPVGSVKLYPPRWIEATDENTAFAVVEGSIFPVDPNGWPINFRVLLPANWSGRAIQSGGGGNNGTISVREGPNSLVDRGFVVYGSDGGHQVEDMRGQTEPLATGPAMGDAWALNEEAIRNLGYMQMKKTYDAARVIMERIYGENPRFTYYVGSSQGGREGLTVAQRYPADYDGIISNVPIVNFSTLMLAPALMRIQEIPLENWVTPEKTSAIRAEFLRQCDELDGLADGVINNYMAARALFDVTDGVGPIDPWTAIRAPGNVDPDPTDTSTEAKLTNGQIQTLEFVYSPYEFATPLANGVQSFGMWIPTIEPDGFGMITDVRYKGQEGAAEDAPVFTHLGSVGITGFLMQALSANPLDYVEGRQWNDRREELSEWLDSTDPDLSEFYEHGGKLIVTIGGMDNIASPGAQLDYYQSLLDEMGRETIDNFARLYVSPQAGHVLRGSSHDENGEGEPVTVKNFSRPNGDDNLELLMAWVEDNQAPSKTLVVNAEGHISTQPAQNGYLLCSYPNYPKYIEGPVERTSSYISATPDLNSLE